MEVVRITLMSDHGVEYPLWDDDGLMDVEELRRDLGLSESLLADLAAWQSAWEAPIRTLSERRLEAKAKPLVRRLRAEAGPGYEFRLHRTPLRARVAGRLRDVFLEPLWKLRHGPP